MQYKDGTQGKILNIGLEKTKYSMGEYEKMKRISFPLSDKYLLMVHTEIQNDHQKIISEILNLSKDISYD